MTNWSELEDAYGAATEVPVQLAALASTDEEERKPGLQVLLFQSISPRFPLLGQRSAIPILFRLALDQNTPGRGDLVQLLLHLAVGYPSYHLTRGFDFANSKLTIEGESEDEKNCYAAVESHVGDLRRMLNDQDASVRLNAAHALAYFRPTDDWTLEQLASLLSVDPSTEVRATSAISLGALTASVNKPESETRSISLLTKFVDNADEQPIVRFGASIGLAYLMQGSFLRRINPHSGGTTRLSAFGNNDSLDEWRHATTGGFCHRSLAAQGNTVAHEALEAMVANANGENAKWLSASLFALVFPDRVTDSTVLTKPQINALQVALSNSALWREGVAGGEPCLWAPPY